MAKILGLAAGLLFLVGFACTVEKAAGQGGGRGSTPQGDILRGQGQFLRGAGWYEFNSARARNIDVQTWKAWNLETERIYTNYMTERYNRVLHRKGLSAKEQEAARRKIAEDQRRWRESPTPEDINSGDALNALASDLANPNILPTSWGNSQVALPSQLSLTVLTFKMVTKQGSNIVAVDRMLAGGEWPLPLRRRELDQESAAYKQAVATVTEKCRKGTPIQFDDYVALRDRVEALRKKVIEVVPMRDKMQATAMDFVRVLDASSKIFADQAYAEQLIRDVSEHKATSVGELLAFMRQYRLLFAEAGTSPEVAQLYGTLYGLLREQRDRLGTSLAAATPAQTGEDHKPETAKLPDAVVKKIEQVRSTVGELKYPRAVKNRTRKDAVIAELNEALTDAANGVVPLDRLKNAERDLKALRGDSTKTADHVRLLNQAVAQLEDALAAVQRGREPIDAGDDSDAPASKKARGRRAAKKKAS